MRRDRLIVLLQPYKNRLFPKKELAAAVNRFAQILLGLCEKYPRLRFNIAMPGYILERADPLVIAPLKDMTKRGSIEWLCMGYTEPFLSFSPIWLTSENVMLGVKVFTELTGEAPTGFVPPFSNWEPSHIDILSGIGLKYAVVSNTTLAKSEAGRTGYWVTEYTGSSMAVFPAQTYGKHDAPQSIAEWVRDTFTDDGDAPQTIALKYLYALTPEKCEDNHGRRQDNLYINSCQQIWLEQIAAEIDKYILELQPLRFKDVLGNTPPQGIHYFLPGLVTSNNEPATPRFLNHLHCYDQIGVMQRKLMDVCDSVRTLKSSKSITKLKRLLFCAQDINRFLPADKSGFCNIGDRLWTYAKLIDTERGLCGLANTHSGVIKLTDFLRNGYKSIIMSNRALKLYIDHKNGAQLYELDYRDRSFNACAAYNPRVRARPNVIVPRESYLGFCDRIFTTPPTYNEYIIGKIKDSANFAESPFEYIFKHSSAGVKVLLNCNNGFTDNSGRDCPLTMDKVFGIEKDDAILSYSYKLGNPSLANYSFTLGIELPLALPGCINGNARLYGNQKKHIILGKEPVIINDIANWEIEDDAAGVRIEFVTQQKVNIWLFQPEAMNTVSPQDNTQNQSGIILLTTIKMDIETNSSASFTGRIQFKKIKAGSALDDSL